MKLINKGKTKDVYALEDGNYLLKFKDELTGTDGVFDPGANTVGLTIEGAGKSGLKMSAHFFKLMQSKGIPTHFVEANLEEGTMVVKKATMFGHGLEAICRYRAVGSFLRRYGLYAKEKQTLDGLVEITLKDDSRNDPLINDDALIMLGIVSKEELYIIKRLTREISDLVKEELAKRDLELYDIKLEFGKIGEHNQIALIDEISGGSMRAYKDGQHVKPLELEKLFFGQ